MPKLLLALLLLAASFGLATAPASASQGTRAIDHEALWLMPRVAAPALSPDGRWSVVQVTRPDYDRDKQASHLWLVATDGRTPPRQITTARSAESGVAWSPDSRTIAFSARRNGDDAAQIYLLDIERGGEARAVTSISTGARLPVFSPDGSRIAFTSDVHPDSRNDEDSKRIAKEEKELDHHVRTFESFPIRNWDRWLENRQTRVFVQAIDAGEARDLLAGTALVAESGYSARTTAGGSELDVAWTPDGSALVFVASTNRHRGAHDFTHNDLWQVPVDGGEPRRITGDGSEAGDNWSSPQFSPDGRTLYAQVTPRTEYVYNATRVGIIDWPAGSERGRIEPTDGRSVLGFAVSPNNRDVFMLVDDAGHAMVYRGSHTGGEARPAFGMDQGMYNNLAMNRSGRPVLVGNFESAVNPAEVVRVDVDRGRHERLTGFAVEKAAQLDLQPLEHFWFENDQGYRVHSLLVKPANFDPSRRYPVFVMMHGGPHLMSRDYFFLRWNYHLLAGEDFVVIMTNYRGSTGFGEAFAQSIQGDPLRGPANDINQALDVAAEKYPFVDAGRACAGGASYGGHLANWLQGTTERYRCLVSHAGLVNLESQWGTSDVAFSREANMGGAPWDLYEVWAEHNPIRLANNWKTPTLVTVGEKDFRVPLNNVLEYWTALQRMQVPGRLLVYPDENHWIMSGGNSRHFYGEVDAWLRRYLIDTD